MFRTRIASLLIWAAGCGGAGSPTAGPDAPADPAPLPLPQAERPAVDAEVIGMPGDRVNGLDAYYVTTMLGWLAPEGDVIFEAVIQWKPDNTLGCGILRRAPEGHVHTLLMQGQPLPGTGGGVVRHPELPLESRGDLLLMEADVEGGAIGHGLFGVPRAGGVPRLLAEGRFLRAVIAEDGTVLAQRAEDYAIVAIAPDQPATVLLPDCEPGFSSDGRCLVARRGQVAWEVAPDGSTRRILGIDDPVPGTTGTVTRVRGAQVNDAGAFVVHVETDDPACPEALLRITDSVEVLVRCGAPAPGTTQRIERIVPAAGRSADVVFAAGLESSGTVVYCAPPGEPPVLVASSGPDYRIRESEVVVDGARIAFGATTPEWDAVYRIAPGEAPERLMGTDGAVPAAGGAALQSFPIPLEIAIDIDGNGRTLVHAGLVEARRPDATLGALLLVR